MRRTTIAGAVGLIFTLSVLGQQVFKLVPKDKSFEVSFPDEPRHEQRDSDSGRIHVEAHSYSWENTTSKFILTYVHLTPAPADLKPSDALDSAISGTVRNANGTLLSQQSATIAGRPAKTVKISVGGGDAIIDGRFIYVNPRVYQLLVLHRNGTEPAFQNQFFDSFTVR